MKKVVIIFGLISGTIITTMMLYAANECYKNPGTFRGNDVLGYAALIASFSFIFVGIKSYRDKRSNGFISFGKAFKIGLLITTVASTLYVVAWLFDFYLFIPDFIEHYTDHVIRVATADGASQKELSEKVEQMARLHEDYKNPLFVIVTTFIEIFPIGLVISLISALILKRKNKPATVPAN